MREVTKVLLQKIERYLRRSGTPPTRFGRLCARDPRLVHDLRHGRQLGAKLTSKVMDYLENNS